MPFVPHSHDDIQHMLDTLGIKHTTDVFDEIPANIPRTDLANIPEGLNELELNRLMQAREPDLSQDRCFIGAGSYWHHIPAIVWQLASRGEFYTAYTPYQAEASQGSLQVIYEYQSIMAHLMAMDVSNASLYDGSTALAEAILMALRIKKSKVKRVLIPENLHPRYRDVLATILKHHDVDCETLTYDTQTGCISAQALANIDPTGLCALVISQPNFFGTLEDVDTLTRFAHEHNALVIGVVNPQAMALIKAPGTWGDNGADIVCGEGQPLGVPMSGGGPFFGFMCCKKAFIRQMPGRIVGRTHDTNGKTGYTLTLQAREQHIRRAKATSNICTNQGLAVTAATIYLTLMGFKGLQQIASMCHQNAHKLKEKLRTIPGIDVVFDRCHYHEFVIRFTDRDLNDALDALNTAFIQGGYPIEVDYPELENCLLVCATEMITDQDIDDFVNALTADVEA